MDSDRKNYYDVLEVETNATPNVIEQAYIRARNAYTGDSVALYSLMTKDECDAILSQIEEAYAVLGFPEKRKEYDRLRGFNQSGFVPIHEPEEKVREVQYEDFGSKIIEAKVSKITAQKKFNLEYSENANMEAEIRDCSEYTGPFLKKVREYKNVSLDRMAEMTRISKSLLSAIEAEDIPKLPADVYVRGYVYQYAKVLKLNPDNVANSFILHFKKIKAKA